MCEILFFFFQLTQKPEEFWNDPDYQELVASGVRLPSEVVPSFYRLKIKADLDTLNFTGEVYITIRASKKVKEITLHSKHLGIGPNPKLTEQIYEKVETLQRRTKRDVEKTSISPTVETKNETQSANTSPSPIINTEKAIDPIKNTEKAIDSLNNTEAILNSTANFTTEKEFNASMRSSNSSVTTDTLANITEFQGNADNITNDRRADLETQVTTSSVRNIKIISIWEASGDRLILTLASALKPNVDYILEMSFQGNISNSMTGFYKSTYKNEKQEERCVKFLKS